MKSTRISILASVAVATLTLGFATWSPLLAQGKIDQKKETSVTVGGAAMFPSRNIIQNAVNSKDHTTLVAAVKAAGLVDTLSGPGPFTVLAPTDAAFKKLPAETVANLLKPENKEMLVKILTCHVVAANAMAPAIMKMIKDAAGEYSVKTVGGCTFTAMMKSGKIVIRDGKGNIANITIADVRQSNGVIHVIDTVLMPN